MMTSINIYVKKKSRKKTFSGQATIEYLLLTALVVGLLLSIYQKQVKALFSNFTSRRTQYTDVVQQKNLGIPLAWFSGKAGRFGDNQGGLNSGSRTNAGGDNDGANGGATAGLNNGGVNSGNTAGRNPQNKKSGSDEDGGEGPDSMGGSGRSGANAGASPNSLNLTNSGLGKNKGRGKGGAQGEGDIEGSDSDDETSGSRGRRRSATNIRGEGSLGDKEKDKSKKQDEAEAVKDNTKSKDKEADEELKKQKELYGSNKGRSVQGGCSKIDLTALIKIAVIVGLLFVIFGMLFQKRGDGQD